MTAKNNLSKQKSDNGWQWWSLNLSTSANQLKKSKISLSRHVLNLRADLKPIIEEAPIKQVPNVVLPKVWPKKNNDFKLKKSVKGLNHYFNQVLKRGSGRYYNQARDVSLIVLVETVLWLSEAVWYLLLSAFLNVYQESGPLIKDIKADIKEFKRLLGLAMFSPWRLITVSQSSNSKSSAGQRVDLTLPVDKKKIVWLQAAGFMILSLVIVVPFKVVATWQSLQERQSTVMSLSHQAIEMIKNGTVNLSNGDIDMAGDNFNQAAATFDQAAKQLQLWPERVMVLLSRLPGKPQQYVAGSYLLQASREVSQAAVLAVESWRSIIGATPEQLGNHLGDTLSVLENTLQEIQPHLDKAADNLSKVDPDSLPQELKERFVLLRQELNQLNGLLHNLMALPVFLQRVVGQTESKTYVVVFQNSSELRPTGGFMGSLAFLDISQGAVQKVNIPGGGPYDFQGSLSRLISPPPPLRLVRGTWQLQDANWWFDWPTSAKKIQWFITESGGPSTNGVIAITPDLVLDLLKLTGPLDFPTYNKVLTADNFLRETQLAVEVDYDRQANRPKQFIADLAPLLVEKVMQLSPAKKGQALLLLEKALASRSLQFYLSDPNLQAEILTYGWAGQVKSVPMDYLAVVRTNIGGGKTDLVTQDTLRHSVEITPTGEMIAKISYQRQHQGRAEDIFEKRRNVDYVRFYLPLGSTLLLARGFTPPPDNYFRAVPEEAELDEDLRLHEEYIATDKESGTRISEESGKTVFANWLSVAPGETQEVNLVYKLPFVLPSTAGWQDLRRYQIYFQRQAGVQPIDFLSTVTWPKDWSVRWQNSSDSLRKQDNQLIFTSDLSKDAYYGLILENLSAAN
ncbi:DUF4012 domain-containing protein [Patescibacteria group bacterium]|nr:DUF4012 domain-containing protein [Patescibacteria group bacterium]